METSRANERVPLDDPLSRRSPPNIYNDKNLHATRSPTVNARRKSLLHELSRYQPVVAPHSPQRVEAIREILAGLKDGNAFVAEFGRPLAMIPIRAALLDFHNMVNWDGEARDKLFRDKYGDNDLVMYPLMSYDNRWMPDLFCNLYLWHLLRREEEQPNIYFLVNNPSEHTDCKYLPVKTPQDFDVVVYMQYTKQSNEKGPYWSWSPSHFGMWYANKVVSKNNAGNVYHHELDAVVQPERKVEESVIFLRKFGEEDPRHQPLQNMLGVFDWVYQNGAVQRESHLLQQPYWWWVVHKIASLSVGAIVKTGSILVSPWLEDRES